MYAAIRRYEGVDRETGTELARRSEELRRRFSERPGFVAYEIIIGDGSIASISVFETWVTAEESNHVAADWVAENLSEFNLPAPLITAGDVYEDAEAGRPPFAPPPRLRMQKPEDEDPALVSLARKLGRSR